MEELVEFLKLVNVFYEKLESNQKIDSIIEEVEESILIYSYSVECSVEDLKNYSEYIKTDEDIDKIYYALGYAYYKFSNSLSDDNKLNSYILKMKK